MYIPGVQGICNAHQNIPVAINHNVEVNRQLNETKCKGTFSDASRTLYEAAGRLAFFKAYVSSNLTMSDNDRLLSPAFADMQPNHQVRHSIRLL